MATTKTTQRSNHRGKSAVRSGSRPKAGTSHAELDQAQVEELLLQMLETEIGGVQVYETALQCAVNDDLKEEWEKYLDETRNHERILRGIFDEVGLDTEKETPGRLVVRHLGESLVQAMEQALEAGEPEAAQLVAAECVIMAETKDHMNWDLLGEVVANMGKDDEGYESFKEAHDEVEQQEDEHLYHTMGWARELWIDSLGIPAALPPPEEERDVKTMIGAARAKQERKSMVRKSAKKGN